MEKITERVLLEKGLPKTDKLEKITSINLSRMGLKNKDLSVALLNKLSALEELDLSGNMLQKLPDGLSLPCTRLLNFSNNDMEDVTSLKVLSGLEELRLDDNLYLTVSDEHKVMFLLPKLKILNGKDIGSTANHIRYVNSEILRKRVIVVWEKNFSLPDPATSQSLKDLEKKFVNAACFQVKYGPSSLNDYTKWRVEMIAKEYLKSLTDPEKDAEDLTAETPVKENGSPLKRNNLHPEENCGSTTSRKRRTINQAAAPEASPRKSSRVASTASVEESPRKSTRLQGTPQKSDPSILSPKCMKTNTPEASQRKSSRLQNTPKKAMVTQVAVTPTAKGAKKNLKVQLATPQACSSTKTENRTTWKATKHQVPKEPAVLQPLHVLQCHSKQDSPDDFSTQLWACAFEPTHNNSNAGAWSQSVATCGGETVCVIDCESGHVLKKYKVPGEEFFSLAWSTVLMAREGGCARSCSILAAGGKRGMVKLIHPRANLAYGEFRASRRAISVLRFSPRQTSFLFSGSYDNKIIMWDIGGLDRDYNFKTSQLIVMETCSTPLHLCLPPCSPDTYLISGCDNGLYSFDIQLNKNMQKRTEEMEIVFPVYKKSNKNNNYRTIDGLSFLTEDIVASKSHMQGSIYLWSWSGTRALIKGRKTEVPAVILAELQWSNTDIPYLSLNTCPGFGYVVCGDEKGRLWTYHVTELSKANFKSGKAVPATEVLEWPSPVRSGAIPVDGPSINNVAMDPELRYLVALSDKNMVVVWKRASES
ncbi:leucine-rich repeat and WD repeat-containing protein 1 isoform X1 [Tachysurus vachellii]|uniref:leucine-rich repeat and WD repeat-containing protein 1 isoform X1 n=1 Tax=Tachysurus vachellii TaxID=175792 RepID=UPI00296AAEDB|nr:leucine-rich repeat and WD repeat-containing protein 1 isoform X1 [Tachysurus vachellii]